MSRFDALFFPHDNKGEHFRSLDGLRGVAVLFVLLSHASNASLHFHEYLNFRGIGKVGVYLFFVLSAYLLDRQIALAYMTGKSSGSYWKNYFLRRFLRIYPLFVIALFTYALLTASGIKTDIDTYSDIPMHLLLLRGESVFWSIPVEFKYYFLSPIIMWICHRYLRWKPRDLLLLFIFSIIFSIAVELMLKLPLVSTLRYLPIFLVGTFISIFELLYKDQLKHLFSAKIYNLAALIAALAILITVPFYFEKFFNITVNFHASEFYFPYALAWAVILVSAKHSKWLVARFLEIKFLRFLGSISFSIYLFHIPVLIIILKTEIPHPVKIYAFFLLTIIFSSISYLLIERPLTKIRIYSKNIREADLILPKTS